ncbi:MAG TPA: cupin domain-containing protein [Pyrinomonadaceae bacterium]|nr:cupin domain-containing protein [Pyrinomonadaceae bacterium]
MARNLTELLEPCSPREFFESSWGRNFLHVKGRPGKFAELLTWERLDELVCRYEFDFPRLHLLKEHQMVPPENFLRHVPNRRDKRVFKAKVQAAALGEQLRQGASLVVDNIEEVSGRPLLELTADLERVFHEHMRVNAYVSFQMTNALHEHWDDHDVLILQVAGRKRWSIHGPTRPYPLPQDIAANPEPGPELTAKPLWEGLLEDGDFFYIPRGWWHRVVPVGGPSIHLSIGVFNRTGVDLLEWVAGQLRASETFRMDLPRFAGPAEREAHFLRLREELQEMWRSPDLFDKFFDYLDGMAAPRPRLGLPWSVVGDVLPDADEARVRLSTLRALKLKPSPDGKSVSFFALGKRWKLPSAALPVLQSLNGGERSLGELGEAAAGRLSGGGVRKLLKQLVTQGLVVLAATPEESAALRATP